MSLSAAAAARKEARAALAVAQRRNDEDRERVLTAAAKANALNAAEADMLRKTASDGTLLATADRLVPSGLRAGDPLRVPPRVAFGRSTSLAALRSAARQELSAHAGAARGDLETGLVMGTDAERRPAHGSLGGITEGKAGVDDDEFDELETLGDAPEEQQPAKLESLFDTVKAAALAADSS